MSDSGAAFSISATLTPTSLTMMFPMVAENFSSPSHGVCVETVLIAVLVSELF